MKRILTALCLLLALPAAAETFNIEIDYMVEYEGGNLHSHMPTQAEIDAVVQMFACQGHTLNIVVDDEITHHDVLRIDPDGEVSSWEYDGSADTFAQLKADNFDNTQGGWHYCIFGHRYEAWDEGVIVASGSSGKAEINGDDLIVTMGGFSGETGTPFEKASTLAHEFGHNLGLRHAGTGLESNIGANSPVLVSIMSYNYQLQGLRTGLLCNELIPESAAGLFKDLDFSHGRFASVNEAYMSEPLGTSWRGVDWNCVDGIQGNVGQDLSSTQSSADWCAKDGSLDILRDYDEWANIVDAAKNAKSAELVGLESSECISWDEVEEMRAKAADCDRPTLVTETCVSEGFYFLSDSGLPGGSGAWVDPLDTVDNSQNQVVPGSALILMPGTYDEGGSGGVVLDQPVKLYSATSAVIK